MAKFFGIPFLCFGLRWDNRGIFTRGLEARSDISAIWLYFWKIGEDNFVTHNLLLIYRFTLLQSGSSWACNCSTFPQSVFNFFNSQAGCVYLAHDEEHQLLQDTHTTKMRVNKTAMGFSLSLWPSACPLLHSHLPFPSVCPGNFVSGLVAKTIVLQRMFNKLLPHELLQVKSL